AGRRNVDVHGRPVVVGIRHGADVGECAVVDGSVDAGRRDEQRGTDCERERGVDGSDDVDSGECGDAGR
ncbi:MAG: hypothetical protein ACK559_29060, partial [bacterium]